MLWLLVYNELYETKRANKDRGEATKTIQVKDEGSLGLGFLVLLFLKKDIVKTQGGKRVL